MKISNCYFDFCKYGPQGKWAYFIELDLDGIDKDIDIIKQDASSYNYIVFMGDVFSQKQEVAKLCRMLRKQNNYVEFFSVITNNYAVQRIVNEMQYIVFFDSEIKNIEWYTKNKSCFFFPVVDEDSLDRVRLLIQQNNIPKKDVVAVVKSTDLNKLIALLKLNNINFMQVIDDGL